MVSCTHEDCKHDTSHKHAQPGCNVGRSRCAFGILCTKHIAHTGTRRYSNPERYGVHDLIGSHDHALCGEIDGAESACGECHYLESPPFSTDMYDSEKGKAGDRESVVEGKRGDLGGRRIIKK